MSLTLATQVQLGMQPQFQEYLAVIFFATLLDYNFHRFWAIHTNPEAARIEKFKWATERLTQLKILIIISLSGLAASLIFIRVEILFVLIPLAAIPLLYSFPFPGKRNYKSPLLKISGLKTIMIALVWTAATVLIPVLQPGNSVKFGPVLLLLLERFTLIFAIAIPFDIRDMQFDTLSGVKTIPIKFGEDSALKISTISLLLALLIAIYHYMDLNMIFILPAYLFSIVSTLIFINNKAFKSLQLYYHGILDGCILLFGILICLSFYLPS